jgi:hypothetical protein
VKGSIAIVGLVVGIVGLLLAMAVRRRWARPLGAFLLIIGVAAQVVALQSRSPSSAQGGRTVVSLPPTGGDLPTTGPQSLPPETLPSFSVPPTRPHLLSQIHPGTEPITKPFVVNKEFVRLANTGSDPIALGGWHLSNGSISYTFPTFTLPPHHSIVLRTGIGTNNATTLHWNLSHYAWPKAGNASLVDAHGAVVQRCPYHLIGTDPSASC